MDKKVSVLIITYDHEKYIAQAVESALQQEVNFPYEIIIGDDCSTDHTREILRELSRAHPERIRLLLHENKGDGLPRKKQFYGYPQSLSVELILFARFPGASAQRHQRAAIFTQLPVPVLNLLRGMCGGLGT